MFKWFWLDSPRSCFFKFLSLFSRRCSFVSNHILLILQLSEVWFWCGFRQSLSHQERNEMASYITIARQIVFRPLAVECSSLVKTRKLQGETKTTFILVFNKLEEIWLLWIIRYAYTHKIYTITISRNTYFTGDRKSNFTKIVQM